jgi:hypothetical protein
MYNRNKKDNYRKKIEELIEGNKGRKKRSRKDSSSSKTSNNDADNDIIIGSNDSTNDDNTSIIFKDIDTTSRNINEIDSASKIRVQKWIPGSTKVEGIRKYLGTNKISHN